MTQKIVVFGATGYQGGSVARALLADGVFEVVGITRDPSKPKAKDLASKGAKLQQADLADSKSLAQALSGAYGVFLNTNFWEAGWKEGEQAKAAIDAAKDAGVTHLLWSTLPDVETESKGKWEVSHFNSKAKVDSYVESKGFKYHTYIVPPFYYSNFLNGLANKGEDGVYNFTLALQADDKLAAFDAEEDTGKPVPSVFKEPEKYGSGYRITYAGTDASYKSYVDTFEKVSGQKARLIEVPREVLQEKTGSKDMAEMFGWFTEYGFYGREGNTNTAAKIASLTPWETFVKKHYA